MDALEKHVYKEYPHIWVDTYLFFTAIVFVIAAAAFSVVARAANLSMWYPLAMLAAPALIAYYTTVRRNAYYKKLSLVKKNHEHVYFMYFKFLFLRSTMNRYKVY